MGGREGFRDKYMNISGFTFVHNAIESGYPIVEAIKAIQPYVGEVVAVDMQSTDGTREVLRRLGVRILDGQWGNQAGETLRQAHSRYRECHGNIIVHFEADEVYDDTLIKKVIELIGMGFSNLSVYRLQLEQNFQRCRWYPEPVHRIFQKSANLVKDGHTTDQHGGANVIGPAFGFLWDITNCFKDNWLNRVRKQAELRNTQSMQYLMTPIHALHKAELSEIEVTAAMNERHWTWTETPFRIPEILRPLVGKIKYEVTV